MSNINGKTQDEFNNSDLTPDIDLDALQAPEINLEDLTPPDIDINGLTPELDALIEAGANQADALLNTLDAAVRPAVQGETQAPESQPPINTTADIPAIAATLQLHVAGLEWVDALQLAQRDVEQFAMFPQWKRNCTDSYAKHPCGATVDKATELVRAKRSALISEHAQVLAAVYESAREQLMKAGVPFSLLVAWHRGERGEASKYE